MNPQSFQITPAFGHFFKLLLQVYNLLRNLLAVEMVPLLTLPSRIYVQF